MYFPMDEILDDKKKREGVEKFESLSPDEKFEYLQQLSSYLRQQAFYAGFDTLHVCRLFKMLADDEKRRILNCIEAENDESDNPSCSGTPLSHLEKILEKISKMRNEDKKEKEKDSKIH